MKSESHFRNLPGIDALINEKPLRLLANIYSHETIANQARLFIEELRLFADTPEDFPTQAEMADTLAQRIKSLGTIGPTRVINATGVIGHTNLGRAPLSQDSLNAVMSASSGYSDLEINLQTGKRGSRQFHIQALLKVITGAEACLVVNNNASAVLLALTALTKKKEVIVSRSQAVEIGGGFRVPDVMRQSGTKLIEVGTTNCTYIADYERAITPSTAALLNVHSSNFKVVGFTNSVPIEELVELGRKQGLNVFHDLGSGCLIDTSQFGLDTEPRVQDSIKAGVDLALFSGDKLLGGPQAGIISGTKDLIDKLAKHPLARAIRIDKSGLAALSATLIHYLKGEATLKIPIWRMIGAPLGEIEKRSKEWVSAIGNRAQSIPGQSTVGGGSLPDSYFPTQLVVIQVPSAVSAKNFSAALRCQPLPLICRIEKNVIVLDPRSVLPEDDAECIKILRQVLSDFS